MISVGCQPCGNEKRRGLSPRRLHPLTVYIPSLLRAALEPSSKRDRLNQQRDDVGSDGDIKQCHPITSSSSGLHRQVPSTLIPTREERSSRPLVASFFVAVRVVHDRVVKPQTLSQIG